MTATTEQIVWVTVRPYTGAGARSVYHRSESCYRRQRQVRPSRIPTIESAAVAAGLTPCRACRDA